MKVVIEENHDFRNMLKEKIKAFNNEISPHHKASRAKGYTTYFHIIEEDGGMFVGGLAGHIYWRTMEIDDFYIEGMYRGNGLGRRMINEAIELAKNNVLDFILLSTFSFQAKTFYEKLGFYVIGEIKDYPPGESLYTMRMDLKKD